MDSAETSVDPGEFWNLPFPKSLYFKCRQHFSESVVTVCVCARVCSVAGVRLVSVLAWSLFCVEVRVSVDDPYSEFFALPAQR